MRVRGAAYGRCATRVAHEDQSSGPCGAGHGRPFDAMTRGVVGECVAGHHDRARSHLFTGSCLFFSSRAATDDNSLRTDWGSSQTDSELVLCTPAAAFATKASADIYEAMLDRRTGALAVSIA